MAKRLSAVQVGMTYEEVVQICGAGSGVPFREKNTFTLGFGAIETDGFPTMGFVKFKDGKADYIVGSATPAIDPNDIPERELRKLLTTLDKRPPALLFDKYTSE
jgi:hypothetical protein